ncbi:MAG: hypothetical protein AAF628_26790 [Planctomycetota bacterium]
MSELHIRMPREFDEESVEVSLVGNVYSIDDDAKTALPHGKRNIVIEAGNTGHQNTLSIPKGRYLLEITMPSGQTIAQDFVMRDGETTEIEVEGQSSPREWLAYQHLAGNVSSLEESGDDDEGWLTTAFARGGALDTGPTKGAGPKAKAYWLLVDARKATLESSIAPKQLDAEPEDLQPTEMDPTAATFRVSAERAPEVWDDGKRGFVLVEAGKESILVAAPLPWEDIRSHRQAAFEVMTPKRSLAVSSMVRDSALGPMLAYMANGSLQPALHLAAKAEDMLFHKISNPLAAVGGACILLETATESGRKNWHGWIENLYRRKSHLPDSAIVYATLLLNHQKEDADVDKALGLLLEGGARGLPYYSRSLRLLLDGLTAFASDPDFKRRRDEVTAMLHDVERVAQRTNFRQIFTTIRLGRRR